MAKTGFKPDNVHKVAILHKTKGTQTRMVINEFEDRSSVDLRQWYKRADMDKFAPTSKGISIPVDELPRFVKAAKKALRIAREEGLLDDE